MKIAFCGVTQLLIGVTAEVKVSGCIHRAAAPFLVEEGGDIGCVCAAYIDVEQVVGLLVGGVDGSVHVQSAAERFAVQRLNLRLRSGNRKGRARIVDGEVRELQRGCGHGSVQCRPGTRLAIQAGEQILDCAALTCSTEQRGFEFRHIN